MKKLELNQMENVQGGSNCRQAFEDGVLIATYGATFGGIAGGSFGLVIFAGLMIMCKQ